MSKQHPDELRRRAEQQLAARDSRIESLEHADLVSLAHELAVHQIELEIQNEELVRTRTLAEEARDRYIDLYEFAPVGYITINREGLISEINLTGSALLGIDRSKLIKRRFSKFVAVQDREIWHRLFMNMMKHATGEKQEFSLEMVRADGPLFSAHFDCLRRETLDTPPMLRVVLTDISKLKLALKV